MASSRKNLFEAFNECVSAGSDLEPDSDESDEYGEYVFDDGDLDLDLDDRDSSTNNQPVAGPSHRDPSPPPPPRRGRGRGNARSFKRTETYFWCPKCKVALCIGQCFEVYHSQIDYTA